MELFDEVALQEHPHSGSTSVFVRQVEVDEGETVTPQIR
jgi:hypothetical protein